MTHHTTPLALVLMALTSYATARADEPAPVPVGTAVVDITPAGPIRLMGYGSRKTESEGSATRLKARALALGADDGDGPAVLVAVDNCAVPARVTDEVAARLRKKARIARERFVVCSSHTHCGPALGGAIPFIFGAPYPPDQQERIDRYTRELTDMLERVALASLADRAPTRLTWGRGSVDFAANRRVLKKGRWLTFGVNPSGPVDHRLPVLAADRAGKPCAIVAGYACHCTTLGGEFNQICADWAGFAAEAIERDHPGAVALIVIGCGADANPEPRGKLDDARRHGEALAREVARLLKSALTPLPSPLTARYRTIELPFGPPPTREKLTEQAKRTGAEGFLARVELERLDRGEELPRTLPNYPVQTWSFGNDLAMVFLGGEVVVDYALRLYAECDAAKLWPVAYSNDVPCYIASRRVLSEGGYEADTSMVYYGRPARFSPEVEDRIVETVHELLPDVFDSPHIKK